MGENGTGRKEQTKMRTIEHKSYDMERAFYGARGVAVKHCTFDGPADGESAFKECRDVRVSDSFFNLRYPFWHDHGLKISGSEMTELCRASLWYSGHIEITDTKMHGIKALRECSDVVIRAGVRCGVAGIRLVGARAGDGRLCGEGRVFYDALRRAAVSPRAPGRQIFLSVHRKFRV